MRIAVIIGVDRETGEPTLLKAGAPEEMRAEARKYATGEKSGKFDQVRYFDQDARRFKATKKKPKKSKKVEADIG
jgi:hypothetical protein